MNGAIIVYSEPKSLLVLLRESAERSLYRHLTRGPPLSRRVYSMPPEKMTFSISESFAPLMMRVAPTPPKNVTSYAHGEDCWFELKYDAKTDSRKIVRQETRIRGHNLGWYPPIDPGLMWRFDDMLTQCGSRPRKRSG